MQAYACDLSKQNNASFSKTLQKLFRKNIIHCFVIFLVSITEANNPLVVHYGLLCEFKINRFKMYPLNANIQFPK